MGLPIKNPLNSLGLTTEPGSLKAFYNKIGSNTSLSKDNYLYYINSPAFFDVSIKNIRPTRDDNHKALGIYSAPLPSTGSSSSGFSISNLAKSAASAAVGAVTNAVGSLVKGLTNNFVSPEQSYDAYISSIKNSVIAGDSILLGIEKYLGNFSLNSDLKYFIQSVTFSDTKIKLKSASNNTYTEYFLAGGNEQSFISPENNTVSLNILDGSTPLIEYLFYPWMAEASSPRWIYPHMPFTKADICVSFMFPNYTQAQEGEGNMLGNLVSKGIDAIGSALGVGSSGDVLASPSFQYIFKNCYPTGVELLKPTQKNRESFTRKVDFNFSHMLVLISGAYQVSATQKLLNAAASRIINPIANKALQPITGNSRLPATSL